MSAISHFFGTIVALIAKRKERAYLEILPWLTLVAALAFTYQLWLHARQDADQALQLDFDYRARDAVDDVNKRMKTYEQVMRGVDGLFAHASYIELAGFHNYILQLQLKENYPGIRGLRFVPLVRNALKGRHIAAIRREGLPSYDIWPQGQRDIYAPVTYSAPLDPRDRQVIGYDMLSDDEYPVPGDTAKGLRRAAMEQARDSGSVAISGKLRLLYKTEQDKQNDFVMLLPVYRFGEAHQTIAERRASIIGWACAVINMDGLMEGILGERSSEIDIEIYDGGEVSDRMMMFDSQPSFMHQQPRYKAIKQLRVADSTWTVAVHSLPGFEQTRDTEKPGIIASTGILISLLLAMFFQMLILSRKRALQTATRLGLEGRKNEMLLRTASDGIHICDFEGNLVQANAAFFHMLGYTQKEMLGMNVTQWDEQWAADVLKAKIGSSGSNSISFETRLRRSDGRIIDAEINASLVEIDGRQLIYNSARDITGRKAAEQQLHNLTAYLQSVREEEKVSIAREIHDDLGGMLTAMKIESYWLKAELSVNKLEATALFDHAQEMAKLIDNASVVMRNIITGLRPTILDDLGLLAALEWQAARFQKLTGIKSRVNCIGDKGDLDRTCSIALFRIAQEALSNVAKHSGASCMEIEFHHSDEEVVLSVIDNGRGITETRTDNAKHYGILGMRERADQLGGKVSIDTPPGGGFNLTVILPLPAGKKRRKHDTHPDRR